MSKLTPAIATLVLFLGAFPADSTPVNLSVQRSGSSVVLNWSGGTGPYNVLRSTSPKMGVNFAVLAENTSNTSYTDTVAARGEDPMPGLGYSYYLISDVSNLPGLNITTPCISPCDFHTDARKVTIGGNYSSSFVAAIYVNDRPATFSGGTFDRMDLPLKVGTNTLTAVIKDSFDNWAANQIEVTRGNGNSPPMITIDFPSDESIVYTPIPTIDVSYADPDGPVAISHLHTFLDGIELTATDPPSSTGATYLVGSPLTNGSHFIYAVISDVPGYSNSASSHFTLGKPVVTSFSPPAGNIGAAITINGSGFDPIASNDMVAFNGGSPVTPSAATATTLDVVIPSGATTGAVVVTVGGPPPSGRSSDGRTFTVSTANILANGIAVNAYQSNHTFFTNGGGDFAGLFEILDNGTSISRCFSGGAGLPVEAGGNLYWGDAVSRYLAASNTCEPYAGDLGTVRLACSNDPSRSCIINQDCVVPGQCQPTEAGATVNGLTLTGSAGSLVVYTADGTNGCIKRIDPMGRCRTGPTQGQTCDHAVDCCLGTECGSCRRNVTTISTVGAFPFPSGVVANSAGNILYFVSGANGENIQSVAIPAGSAPMAVHGVPQNCFGGSTGARGLAITSDDKLLVARGHCLSWLEPSSSASDFWDLWTGGFDVRSVALGADGDGTFILIGEDSRAFRIPKPGIVLTANNGGALPSKIMADFAPGVVDCVSSNAISLQVTTQPGTLVPDTSPRQRVRWTIEDPDDPAQNCIVDPSDCSGPPDEDNIVPLGTYPQWEAVAGFPIITGTPEDNSVETEINGHVSRVKVHFSCQPGDNYRIKASITAPIYGSIDTVSDVITIWRKLHVELDSMGQVVGPLDDDDADFGDVPEPVFDLNYWNNAFKPAYIVVVPPDTGQNTANVPFWYNVPLPPTGNVERQGRLGRGSISTPGYWVVYSQAAYESDVSLDYDPDTEGGYLGVVEPSHTRGRFSLVFVETIRDATTATGLDNEYYALFVPLHEIGHEFNLEDETGCIMDTGPNDKPVFCPGHILQIRSVPQPSDQETPP